MRLGATTDMRYVIISGGKVFLKNLPSNMIRVIGVGPKAILWMHGRSYQIYDGGSIKDKLDDQPFNPPRITRGAGEYYAEKLQAIFDHMEGTTE